MLAYTVSTNLTAPLGVLKNSEKRRSYAMANAINTVAKRIQAAVRASVRGSFTVRRPEFIMRQAAIIKPFASGGRRQLEAKVAVGQRARLLLSEYEAGGNRKPFKGRRVAVPITGGPARPSKSKEVTAQLTFRSMKLTKVRAGSNVAGKPSPKKRGPASAQLKGAQRTFVIRSSPRQPEGGVYQRTGRGPESIRLVYAFDPSVRLKPQLKFMATAMPIARQLEREVTLEVGRTFRYQLQGAR